MWLFSTCIAKPKVTREALLSLIPRSFVSIDLSFHHQFFAMGETQNTEATLRCIPRELMPLNFDPDRSYEYGHHEYDSSSFSLRPRKRSPWKLAQMYVYRTLPLIIFIFCTFSFSSLSFSHFILLHNYSHSYKYSKNSILYNLK